jgi:polysaccharide export outer membrane protein
MRQPINSPSSAYRPRLCALAIVFLSTAAVCLAQQPSSNSSAGNDIAAPGPAAANHTAAVDDRYRIGPGDLINITTLDYPQLSSDGVRVDSKGMILLPMVSGEIEAACNTEGELAQEISKRYLKYLKDPQVKVFVKEYQSQTVAVIGAVNAPGRFQLQRRVHLLELLTFVNGPAERAGQTVQIIHSGSTRVCAAEGSANEDLTDSGLVTLKLSETLRATAAANPWVHPGDIITVPVADEYYILGNIAKPSSYPLRAALTLGQAIAIAGGTLPDSNTQRIHIERHPPDGTKTDIYVDLKAVAKQRAPEVLLQPNDIVEVTKAGGVGMAMKTMFRSMVPMVAQLPLRVIY